MSTLTTSTIGGGPGIPPDTLAPITVRYIIITVVLQALSTVAVALRFLSRRLVRAVGWDDWASLAALVFSYGHTAAVLLCAITGKGGFHIGSFTLVQLGEFIKDVLIWNVTLATCTTCSKIALLWFYRRVFLTQAIRIWVWIFIAFSVIAYWLVGCCLLIFSNDPIDSQWKPWIVPRHTLGTKPTFEYVIIADMVTDIGILCLPQALVWKLQVPLRRKLLISVLFLLGAFTCATTVLRLYYVIKLDEDFTFHVVRAGLWGTIEAHLSIIIGCAPMFPKLFRHWFSSSSPPKRTDAKSPTTTTDSSIPKSSPQTHEMRSSSSSSSSTRIEQPSLGHGIPPKGTVRVQTDIEIGHVDRSLESLDGDGDGDDMGMGLAREYGWLVPPAANSVPRLSRASG